MGRPFLYQGICIERLRRAHAKVAVIAMDDRAALVIFERLDRELRAAEAMQANDPVSAARRLLATQNATD
ncbi:hypothetical protein [Pseudogemmobacter humi]|uniref:Uncharacterized protein n=1 Tax=Pseudogemmobacter humi TaxID=2483812 RepID=A0A3P5X1Q9_9RHOB|nr:hypothetical protein [Pseudogemmobacter humi]VDC28266.1 hypothetical protein XINFAN_02041 [Pseudogemmobacter humi]